MPTNLATLGAGGANAVIVDPATKSGMKEWWKASSGIGVADGAAVTTWTGSIQSLAPTQATAGSKPTYRQTGGPNGTPAVEFDGGDWLSVSTLGSNLFGTNACHVFIVMKQNGSDAQNTPFSWWSGAGEVVEMLATYDDVIYFDWNSNPAGRVSVSQPAGWDNNWHIVQFIREAPDSGTSRIRVDGSQLVSGSVSGALNTALSKGVNIGSQTAAGAIFFTGFISDILVANVSYGTTDRQDIETYLNSLYTIF